VKAEVANTAAPVAGEHQQLATELLKHLGGKENVESVLACATSRLRLEIKNDAVINEKALKNAGVSHVMKINERIVHLLLGDEASGTEQAMKALL
jgi:glucose-like phosphotransferase system IIB component